MPEELDITYKNLCFKINSEHNYLEVVIDDINFSDQESYIASVSVMLEYALSVSPYFIILNKLNSQFKISPVLYSFTTKNIIDPLRSSGVRKIICLASEEEYQNHYKDIEIMEPFIKGMTSKAEAIKWIRENRLSKFEINIPIS
ncbi:MAG: hypothetical protein JZU49_04025 [Sulfuricurvum sp.]|nr:hypothetical protein [Sulfuricurvum sp.]